MSITTISNTGSPQPFYLYPQMQPTPQPNLIAMSWAQNFSIPANSGTILRNTRMNNMKPVLTPIPPGSQGSPPQPLVYTTVDTPVNNYGMSTYIDVFNIATNQLPLTEEAGKRLGIAMMQSEDLIGWNTLASSTNTIRATGGGNGDDPTDPSYNDLLLLSTALQNQQAMIVMKAQPGTLRFGSSPNPASYWMMTNTALNATFRSNSQFLPTERYPEPVYAEEEIGSMGQIRIFSTQVAPIYPQLSANGNPIYISAYGGVHAYSNVHVEGFERVIDFVPANMTGPSGQQVGLNARTMFGCGIIQSTWMGTFLCTASLAAA